MEVVMVSDNTSCITVIKNAIRYDKYFNNLITDMLQSNPAFATYQKRLIDARIAVYA